MRLSATDRWRILIITGVIVASIAISQSPSRIYLALLMLVGVGLLTVTQDVRTLLLAFPAVALLVPFQLSTGTDVSLNSAVFGAVGVISFGIVQKFLKRDLHLVRSRLNPPLIAFSLVSVLSLLVGNAMWDLGVPRPPNLLLVQIGQLAIYLLSFLILWFTSVVVTNLLWLRRLTYAVIITGGVGMILVLVSRLYPIRLPLGGVMLNMFTVWFIPLALAEATYNTDLVRTRRNQLTAVSILGILAVVLIWFVDANWVGGWFPPLLALGLLLWFRYPHLRGFMIAVVVTVFFVVGLQPFLQALGFDIEQKWDVSGGSRLALWRSVIQLTSPRPVLGLGIAAYRHYHLLKPLQYGNVLWMQPRVSAHNMFLDLFAQVGILGLVCYLWFLIEALLLAWRLYRTSTGYVRGYASAAFCAIIGTLAADMLAETSLPFVYNMGFGGFRASAISWMMLGGLVVLENIEHLTRTPSVQKSITVG